MSNLNVCVIGAGVVGLNTALQIQNEFPSVKLTVIADEFTPETTSDGAAGLFDPHPSFQGPDIPTTRQWIRDSFMYYNGMMRSSNPCNITAISGYNFSNYSEKIVENQYMKMVTDDYRKITEEELEQFGGVIKYGTHFTTMVIPCKKVLPFWTNLINKNGGVMKELSVTDLGEVAAEYDVVFNCTGLGAKFLCDDLEMVPIRGQIIQVKAPWVKKFYTLDFITYVIPCGYDDVVTMGGTMDFGYYETGVDEYTRKSIRNRCEQILPSLKTASGLRDWVGLRPYRPRVRVEVEKRGNCIIVHNYGHGGFGVTSAPGTAKYALQLLQHQHRSSADSIMNQDR